MARFEDVLTIKNGRNQKNVENPNGKYPIYGSGGTIGYADDYICKAETVVIGRKGNINKPIYVSEPFWNVDTAFGLVANSDILLPKYLYYFCEKFDFEKLNTTVTIPSLTKANLLKINISIPSLGEQKKIAEILDKESNLISLRKKQIEKLDLLVKSRFVEMFGDPVINPKGWKIEKLKKLSAIIISGNTPKGGSQVYVDKGITFFRSQNVWRNRLEMDDIAYIDEETHKKMRKSSLNNRDILMTKTGRINTENSSLGRAAMYLGKDDSANINGHVYLIRLKKDIINEFILFILTTDEYREYIRSVCVGGIDKRQINKEHLEEFPIILPSQELQMQFVEFVKEVHKLKSNIQQSIGKLELSYNALMQQHFE